MKQVDYRKVIQYVLMFLLFFLCLQFFYSCFQGDQVYNFGFSYAVSRGEVPYRDFNMIVTPVGAFLYAIPFLIFGSHMIVFNLFQALLLCLMFHFLFKLYEQRTWILFVLLFFPYPIPFPTLLFQGYNFLLLFELILLLYLEKTKADDYLIGFILGLSFLTKQTVGLALALPSFYYLFKNKDYKKVLKRAGTFLSINIVFVIYLLITNSFSQFIDLCFLGLFDFTKQNGTIFDANFIIFLIEIICILVFIIKDKKNINNYYVLAFSTIAIPLFDFWHVALFTYAFLFLIVEKLRMREFKNIEFCCILLTYALPITLFILIYDFNLPELSNFKGLELSIISSDVKREFADISNYIDNNENKNIIILSNNTYFLKIINDLDITYYDLLNYGNHGYDGNNKIINRIKSEKNPTFIVNVDAYKEKSRRQQFNREIVKYVLDNYKQVEILDNYVIYE